MRFNKKTVGRKNEDRAIVEGLASGDPHAFRVIYDKFRSPIMVFVSGFIKNKDHSEDLTQEIFMKVYQFRHTYVPFMHFSTWLWTVAKNTVYDHLRKKDPMRAQQLHPDELADPSKNAERLLIDHLERAQIEKWMAGLTPLQREALRLRVFKRLSYHEISLRMNTTLSSVKSLISRARISLIDLAQA